jgi:DNA repair protein RAD5
MRRKGAQQPPEQNRDEQTISDSSLSKLVGAADSYSLEVNRFESCLVFSESKKITPFELFSFLS